MGWVETQAEQAGSRQFRALLRGRAGLAILIWHALFALAYVIGVTFVPEHTAGGGCADYLWRCLEPRAGYMFVGLAAGIPTLAISMVLAAFVLRSSANATKTGLAAGSLASWISMFLALTALMTVGFVVGILTAE